MIVDINDATRVRRTGGRRPETPPVAGVPEAGATLARIEFLFGTSSDLREHAQALLREARLILESDLGPRRRIDAASLVVRSEALLSALHDTIAMWALGPDPAGAPGVRTGRSKARRRAPHCHAR